MGGEGEMDIEEKNRENQFVRKGDQAGVWQ